jgi:hypothetical protein
VILYVYDGYQRCTYLVRCIAFSTALRPCYMMMQVHQHVQPVYANQHKALVTMLNIMRHMCLIAIAQLYQVLKGAFY